MRKAKDESRTTPQVHRPVQPDRSRPERLIRTDSEHHDDSRDMLKILLGLAGYEVATASTVTEALSLASLRWFDLYILEVRFPDGSGVELCRQIRALHPQTPILFYTSSAYRYDIQAGLAAGAQRYLVKPMDLPLIGEAVASLLVPVREKYTYAL